MKITPRKTLPNPTKPVSGNPEDMVEVRAWDPNLGPVDSTGKPIGQFKTVVRDYTGIFVVHEDMLRNGPSQDVFKPDADGNVYYGMPESIKGIPAWELTESMLKGPGGWVTREEMISALYDEGEQSTLPGTENVTAVVDIQTSVQELIHTLTTVGVDVRAELARITEASKRIR